VLVASEDVETREELAERLDWDDVPFHLASSAEEALEIVFALPSGIRLLVLLDFERLPRATVMDALRARPDLRPAVAGYLYSLVERHGAVA